MNVESAVIKTPFTKLELVFESGLLVSVDLFSTKKLLLAKSDHAIKTCQQVADYCSGQLPDLAFHVELQSKGTLFQQKVWQALRQIPAGQVKTYGELAQQLNTSARAVGNACRANPIPLLIPCHRVVSKTGIGGFSGGRDGAPLKIKRWLLDHEGVSV
ncbi:MAG: methylated-DNA--[protein]-cysteine S-methyltransferase [Gammaproteobacteria bacterium]|nr:methylated-DNA--[protein]-cysteine S-methyltransferase [Gammaproteobacteria bacterium]